MLRKQDYVAQTLASGMLNLTVVTGRKSATLFGDALNRRTIRHEEDYNGILKVQEPDDPDSCVLEIVGCVMWCGNVFSDKAHAMFAASQKVVKLRPTPVALLPLQT